MSENGFNKQKCCVANGCNKCGKKEEVKVLKCLHEFCVDCLTQTLNSCLLCPECGRNTQITNAKSISYLPSAIVQGHVSQDNCNNHTSERLTHYCVSCQIPVCNVCVEKDHGDMPHVVKLVSETTDMFVRCLTVAHCDALRVKDSLDLSVANLIRSVDKDRAEEGKVRESINRRYEELSSALEAARDEALNKLEELERQRIPSDRLGLLEKGVLEAERCLATFRAVFDHGSDLQKVTYSRILAGKNEEIMKADDCVESPEIRFVCGAGTLGESIRSLFGCVRTDDEECSPAPFSPVPRECGMRKPMGEPAYSDQPLYNRGNGWYQTHLNPDYYNLTAYEQPSDGRFFNKRPVRLSPMETIYKFGLLGVGVNCFSSPHGFCMGGTKADERVFIADTNNHRIQIFRVDGQFVHNFGLSGREDGRIWYPRKVAYLKTSRCVVVCDRGSERSRMQIFTEEGVFVRKIIIRYIDIVAGLVVTSFTGGVVRNDGERMDTSEVIVAVDSVSPTVFIISEMGDLLRWFDCSDHMREPSDIIVHNDLFYICDFKGHSVVVFSSCGKFIHKIGNENITNFPNGIDIGSSGDILVGDSHGNRFHVAVFSMTGELITEFECPKIKVSRCCGLKITSEGYVVTLAKNNHHVLVLNRLFI